MLEPNGYTIFCDDVREEVTGKYSLIGVYRDVLIIQGTFPAKLAKLCVVLYYRQPASLPILPLSLKVFGPNSEDEPLVVAESNMPELIKPSADPTNRHHSMQAVVVLSDILVAHEGKFKVRVYRDDQEIRCGTLRVTTVEAEEKSVAGEFE